MFNKDAKIRGERFVAIECIAGDLDCKENVVENSIIACMKNCIVNVETENAIFPNEQTRVKVRAFEAKVIRERLSNLVVPAIRSPLIPVQASGDFHDFACKVWIGFLIAWR